MGESNGDWGYLQSLDPDAAERWDRYERLPEPGVNPVFDAWLTRKHITLGGLTRVGARLSKPTELAYVFPGGTKFRDYVTGERRGSANLGLKIVKQDHETGTVIIAEGETDAAWLTTHFDADVAVLPYGASTFHDDYAAALSGYARILVGLDNDAAGDAGAALIVASVPRAQRLRPPSGAVDWCEADQVASLPAPTPENQSAEIVGGIMFTDLTRAWRGELAAPVVIVDDLIYDQGVHWISGHPDSGKSILAMHIAWMVMADQEVARDVVWLDFEQGERMTGQRLAEMGVPERLLVERFHWTWYPADALDALPAIAKRWPKCMVVVDSMSKALARAGIAENENTEVLNWTIKLIQHAKENSLPTLVIDHVTKADRGGPYARGAGTKQADTDVHWKVEKLEDFTREQRGMIELTRHKDREGYLPKHLWFTVGDGAGGLGVERLFDPPEI